jgi:hypothetical protein
MQGKKTAPDLQGETFGEAVTTDQEHTNRLARYSKAKERQQTVIDYIADQPDLSKELRQVSGCGGVLIFKRFLENNFRKLVGGISCKKHLLCQLCALRRDSRQIREYALKIEHVLSENPGLIPVLITRTVANGPGLAECYNHLGGIHKVLMKCRRESLSERSTARGRAANSVMQYVAGSVGTYEFKKGKNSGNWHPHIHEVAFLEPVFKFTPEEEPAWRMGEDGELEEYTRTIHVPLEFQSRLAQEYWMISGDSFIVDVRRIDLADVSTLDERELSDFTKEDKSPDQLKLVKALCEVFKYALKYNELSVEDQVHAYRVLKGRRLIFSYGCLRGVKVPDNLVDSAVSELEIGEYEYELYKSYLTGYQLSRIMPEQEFDDMQESAAISSRMHHLEKKEQRLEYNGLRIHSHNGKVITSKDVKAFVDENKESILGRGK